MNPKQRHKSRVLALQAIYQWQFTAQPIKVVEAQFYDQVSKTKADFAYFSEIVRGVIDNVSILDGKIKPFLDREVLDLDPVELAVLRLAVYEFIYRLDIPYKVIINEALDITKEFGALDGFKYVNGVLDKVAKEIRITEIN